MQRKRVVICGSSGNIVDMTQRDRRDEHSPGLNIPPNSHPSFRSSPRDSLGSGRVAVRSVQWAPTPQQSPWSGGGRDRTYTSCCQSHRE